MNSRVISSPENVTATLFVFWLMSAVLLAGVDWQMVDLNSVSSPIDLMKSLGKLSFLVSVVVFSFILAFSQPQKSVGILELVFSVFSIYS